MKRAHWILLILACVFLVIALRGTWVLLADFLPAETPDYPSDVGPGGLFAILLGEMLRGATLFVLLAGFVPYACLGLVFSGFLVSRRRVLPRWAWSLSLVLTVVYGLLGAGLIAVWLLT